MTLYDIANYRMLAAVDLEELNKAFQFYCKSPDGQYDLIAAQAIACIMQIRKAVREGDLK